MVLRTAERITSECDRRHSSLFIADDIEVFVYDSLYLASHHRCDITHKQNCPMNELEVATVADLRPWSSIGLYVRTARMGQNKFELCAVYGLRKRFRMPRF